MRFQRGAGVLLNISSLPSEFGIGCFSKNAEDFASFVSDMGFHWWQILPITTLGWGNSPYSGLSTYAGNSLYINPYELLNEGLINEGELNESKYHGEPYLADYEFAKWNTSKLLGLAFSRLSDEVRARVAAFAEENADWLDDYALFCAISEEYGVKWNEWPKPLRFREKDALEQARRDRAERVAYYQFEQYEFYRQWRSIKRKINNCGVGIIGDLPFYVCTDSVDVWSNRNLFQLDEEGKPTAISGVPPDAFAAKGQIWGNCLYDFSAMEKDGYAWWLSRIKHCLGLYDALRLDHFRGFYNYFSIPVEDVDTAENGHWEFGPGMKLFSKLEQIAPKAKIIAEDLGLMDEAVTEFVEESGFPRMKVFQFGFDGTPSAHLPHNYDVNCIAYTGTHDNNTTLGWLYDLNDSARTFALKYCSYEGGGWGAGGPRCQSTKAIIKTVIASSAVLAVIPVQDLLGYGGDARMNVPGVADGNWRFRVPLDALMSIDRNCFLELNNTYGRNAIGFEAK